MAKIINKVINNCGECPFLGYQGDDGFFHIGYYCKNEDSKSKRISNDEEKHISQIPIPEWCGLPNNQ